jgi:hypothetical protein
VPSGWRPRGIARRFHSVFDADLLVVANESAPALAPVLEPD